MTRWPLGLGSVGSLFGPFLLGYAAKLEQLIFVSKIVFIK